MKTTILLDHEPVADGGWLVRALLKLEGEAAEPAAGRAPVNLAIVLDRSGSMAGPKLEAAREAAAFLVRRLAPEDVVSVVAYDDGVWTVAPPATGEAQQDLPERIEGIEAGGSTNLSGGWLRGRELVADGRADGRINRVLLLTDGLANVGITDPAQLVGLCARAHETGISTTTIGFGADYDERLLRDMADAAGGNTYYIEAPDQAPAVFGHELEGLLTLAAQNVSVTVRAGAGATLAASWHSYPSFDTPDGLRLELGDLYAREPKPLLLEFLVEGESEPMPVAELVVKATVLRADGTISAEELALPIEVSRAGGAHVDPEVRREVLLLQAARAREAALRARERGDDAGAAAMLRDLGASLAASPMCLEDLEVAEEAADLQQLADRAATHGVSEADAKYLFQRAHDASRGARSRSRLISRRKPEE